ncbi:MAG: S8 family serine peptidase [Alloprevotella sp.]
MKTYSLVLASFIGGLSALPVTAQVSNDNEYGVYQVDESQSLQAFVPGQVLVKFKDSQPVSVQRLRGVYKSTSSLGVTNVLAKYGVSSMEKLLPAEVAKPQSALRKVRGFRGETVEENNLDQIYHLKFASEAPDSVLMLVEELKTLDEVEYAEPNYYYYATGTPAATTMAVPAWLPRPADDEPAADEGVICANPTQNPFYSLQWGIRALNIDQLWSKPIVNSKRPVIAILDTGVDITHPDLKDNIWNNPLETEGEAGYDDDGNGFVDDTHGWDFVYNYHEMDDNNSHGTHVAGIAAAADNAIGIVGANPKALIMPVKVLDDDGRGTLADVVKGINYAAQNGADIINLSLGSGAISAAMVEALENAYITSTIVASAGNSGKSIYDTMGGLNYPAAYYCVIGVQASNPAGTMAGFSNYDPDGPVFSRCDISLDLNRVKDPTVVYGINYEVKAPGVYIMSSVPGGNYVAYNGTSMASPLVAGAISALKMVKADVTNDALMTDLAHMDCDFARVYGDEARVPEIFLAGMTIDDALEGNKSPDGEADAGETLNIYPTLLNGWGNSGAISMHLEVDAEKAPFITIDNPDVDFGYSIDAFSHLRSKNPFVVHVSEDVGDNAQVKFVLSCTDENHDKSYEYYMSVKNMSKIGGLIDKDTVLTADVAWRVTQDIGIMKGVTMTIEPGARLEFDEGMGISSFGKLVAKGTPEKPIIMTGYNNAKWRGVYSHQSEDNTTSTGIYRNEDWTKFTLKYTDETPTKISYGNAYHGQNWYYPDEENLSPRKEFSLYDYIMKAVGTRDFTDKQNLLTDSGFLTPIVLQMMADFDAYEAECATQYATEPGEGHSKSFYNSKAFDFTYQIYANPRDTISYCKMSGYSGRILSTHPVMKDCEISKSSGCAYGMALINSNVLNSRINQFDYPYLNMFLFSSNFINNWENIHMLASDMCKYSDLKNCNYINNYTGTYGNNRYMLAIDSDTPVLDHSDYPSYLGSSREDLIRPYLYEIGNAPSTFGKIDLSNMPSQPYAEPHGILWKVVVNGKDCQDEFEELDALGVGTHQVQLYFNRPMNKEKAPQVTYGVRRPYAQHKLEGGTWNEEGTIFTLDMKLTGRESTDGLNRFFVSGAEDNEYFTCPYDSTRFNVLIQSAGSLATGFAAEPKMGRVDLKWNNENNDFSDAMGFNVYRYDENNDTLRINKEILHIESTDFTDYDVTPGKTYWYYYKVLSTDLQEYDISNVVAATPLTSTKGDANGSGDVDVADVITTVNYAAGMSPKPFIYEAADMNEDSSIDILDVVGIIQNILNPGAEATALAEGTAKYSIENGVLYVESTVALAGVQVRLNVEKGRVISVDESLNGFEQTSAWLSDQDWIFLAYNLNGKTLPAGKHALLHIGEAGLSTLCLSDANGRNVKVTQAETTAIDHIEGSLKTTGSIHSLDGKTISVDDKQKDQLPKGVYIVNGEKVVK